MPAPPQQTLLPTRRVAMYLVGSRGDVQPFISLILKLKQQVQIDATKFGPAVVRVYVPADFESLLRPFMMDGQAFSFKVLPHFEMKKRMQTDPDVRAAMATGNNKDIGKLLLRKTFLDHMNKDAFVALHDMMEFKPDVIVYNYVACLYGDTIAQILKIPAVLIGMQMMGSYSSVEAPWALDPKVAKRLPGWAIRIFWSLMLMDMYKKTLAMKEYTFALRKANSLPPLSFKEYKAIVFGKRAGVTALIARSPTINPPPSDWSITLRSSVIGDFILDEETQTRAWPPSPELLKFVQDTGEKPLVYLGWGSMVSGDPAKMTELALRVLYNSGRRGVLLAGWAGLDPSLLSPTLSDAKEILTYTSKNVLVVNDAPHEWLFRRCSVLVHHGGAGTTAAALRSGVPSVVTPCFCDQPELAAKVEKLGVGIALKQFRHLTAKSLQEAIEKVLANHPMKLRAKELGKRLAREDGATAAAQIILGQ